MCSSDLFKKVDFRTRSTLWAIVIAAVVVVITVKYRYVMPVVLFSSYLLYGMIRPWISLKWRKEIEVEEDPELEDSPVTINTSETIPTESQETTR